jgi:hypothetical protein
MGRLLTCLILFSGLLVFSGCVTAPQPAPLTYFSIEKPQGIIATDTRKSLDLSFYRGGWYFLNYGFRPAVDIKDYVTQAGGDRQDQIFRNFEIRTTVPFAFDIFFCGYNLGADRLTASN